MSMSQFQMRRTGWDVVLGVLLVLGGLVILGDAALATTVSVMFVGWVLLIVGLLGLVGSLFRIGKGGFWSAALSGGLLAVLGLFFLRNTEAGAVTLTLIAGTVFLAGGIVRLALSSQEPEYRAVLLVGGAISTILGLIVLLNLFDASLVLMGVLIGIQVLVDGLMLILVGRWHATPVLEAHGAHAH